MAPWPEVGERKAPDKEDHTCTVESPTRGDLVITAEIAHASVGDQVCIDNNVIFRPSYQIQLFFSYNILECIYITSQLSYYVGN